MTVLIVSSKVDSKETKPESQKKKRTTVQTAVKSPKKQKAQSSSTHSKIHSKNQSSALQPPPTKSSSSLVASALPDVELATKDISDVIDDQPEPISSAILGKIYLLLRAAFDISDGCTTKADILDKAVEQGLTEEEFLLAIEYMEAENKIMCDGNDIYEI